MKSFLLLLIVVSVSTISSAQIVGTWKAGIAFENNSVDLGNVEKGAVKQVSLPFINDGTEPLVIKGYKSSSKAANVILPKNPIKPGEKSEIIIEYSANAAGQFKEKILLRTNAQKKPVVLKIYGAIK